MTISRRQRALFWVAEVKLRLSMMDFFEYCGFQPLVSKGPNYGDRPGMASFRQIEFIRTLWHEYTGGKAGEDELNKWLLNKCKLSSLRFLPADKAGKVITALKVMKSRAA